MPVDPLIQAAKENLKRATDGRALNGLTGVNAGDVIAVCASLATDKKTGVTDALLMGATNAGPRSEVWMNTAHLLHLLDRVG